MKKNIQSDSTRPNVGMKKSNLTHRSKCGHEEKTKLTHQSKCGHEADFLYVAVTKMSPAVGFMLASSWRRKMKSEMSPAVGFNGENVRKAK